jgi:hypothetical protein
MHASGQKERDVSGVVTCRIWVGAAQRGPTSRGQIDAQHIRAIDLGFLVAALCRSVSVRVSGRQARSVWLM